MILGIGTLKKGHFQLSPGIWSPGQDQGVMCFTLFNRIFLIQNYDTQHLISLIFIGAIKKSGYTKYVN
jgi:hypothetical protein